MMTTYRVEIPGWLPCRLNQLLGDWRRAARLKKRDRQVVGLACQVARVPPATGKRRVTLTIVLGHGQRGGDPDCFWKSLCDALVHAGALKGDSREWVELSPVVYERDRARGPGCVIELEDVRE